MRENGRPPPVTVRKWSGWAPADNPYDYDYAPRLEHYFHAAEYSYCGSIGVWATNPQLVARRRCYRCILYMVRDGLLRVSGTRRGTW